VAAEIGHAGRRAADAIPARAIHFRRCRSHARARRPRMRWPTSRRRSRTATCRRTHDRYGHRIDEVELHPAWHELMRISIGSGIASLPWPRSRARDGGRAHRALPRGLEL